MFYKIKVQTVERPFHNLYTSFFKSILHCLCCMKRSIVLHEDEVQMIDFMKVVLQNLNI